MRCGNASKMACVPITFECTSYQALNLYYMCYVDSAFDLDTPSPKLSVWYIFFQKNIVLLVV